MLIFLQSAAHILGQWFVHAAGWVYHLFHAKWTIIGGAVSVGAALTKILPPVTTKYQAWSDYRLLKRRVGADLYTREDLIRATEYYVEPECQSVDPAGQEDFRRVVTVRSPAHRALRDLLGPTSAERFLILLADSGMGKSTLLMNFYAQYGRRKRGEHKIVLVPLGHHQADELITKVCDKSSTILFLDAFDEDTKAIHDYKERIATLVELSKDFSRVLMSCRTQFFATDAEIPQETGLLKIGTVRAGQSRAYTFSKLYLSPFSESQIDRYIRKRFAFWQRERRKRAHELIAQAPDLTMRPMLLSHIPDLIDQHFFIGNAASLYKAMTEAWFIRERPLVEPEPLYRFSIALALDLYAQREQRGSEKIAPHEALALAHQLNIPLESWQMRGRSLVNRDSDGKLKFSHRSLMEYFFIVGFLENPSAYPKVPWTDQMKRFWWDMISTRHNGRTLDAESSQSSDLWRDFHNARLHGDLSDFARLGVHSFYISGYGILHSSKASAKLWVPPLLLEKVVIPLGYRQQRRMQCVADFALGLLWDTQVHEAPNEATAQSIVREIADYRWRLPSKYEAAALLAERDPAFRMDYYPSELFDQWADVIWVVDEDGSLLRLQYGASDEKDALYPSDSYLIPLKRRESNESSSAYARELVDYFSAESGDSPLALASVRLVSDIIPMLMHQLYEPVMEQ
jgi:hypothetical protein